MKLDEVKTGMIFRCDGGFTCLCENELVVVNQDNKRTGIESLYIRCDDGEHYIDGQVDFDDQETLIGLEYVGSIFEQNEMKLLLDAMNIAYVDDDAPVYDDNPNAVEQLKVLDKKIRDAVRVA